METVRRELPFRDEQQAARLLAEAAFGAREISPCLASLDAGAAVLEVGCGAGVLLTRLADEFRTLSFTGVEPIGPGFAQFAESLAAIENSYDNVTIMRQRIEDMQSPGTFDLIFSVNVFEHLDDWRRGIDICLSMLKPGGALVILCPNYNIPYESHFALPILFGKSFTERVFGSRIRQLEERLDAHGLWKSLNFIKASELSRYCREKRYAATFDRAIMRRMLDRLEEDAEFRKRQSALAQVAIAANRMGAGRLLEILPAPFGAYMKITVRPAA